MARPQRAGAHRRRLVGGGDEGRQPDRLGRQAQEEVNHGAVAGHRRPVDVGGLRAHALRRARQQPVERLHHKRLQLAQAVVLASIDDARDDILAARDLPVVIHGFGDDLAGEQVHQVDDIARRADVDGRAEQPFGLATGQHIHQPRQGVRVIPAAALDDGRHLPVRGAQRASQRAQDAQVGGDALDAVVAAQGALHARPVVGLVVHAGRVEFKGIRSQHLVARRNVIERHFHGGDRAVGHQPPLDLLLRRDQDAGVALDDRLAGQRIALRHVRAGEAQVGAPARRALLDEHGTAPAAPLPAARHVQVEAGFVRGLTEQRAHGDGDGSIGRGEGNGIGGHVGFGVTSNA